MIRITRQSDYGIVLMSSFAGADGAVRNARDLAEETRLPYPTVSKILKALARGGLLASHRGVKGGYSLARPPEEISIGAIVQALEGPIAITACLDEHADDCDIESCCPVRANWMRINQVVQRALDEIALSEMVRGFPPRPGAPVAAAAQTPEQNA